MAKKKSSDRSGVVAEMLQQGTLQLRELIAEVFKDILKGAIQTPACWKQSFITVLFKKWDPR
eukprot:3641509-Karenia_brevis.AAC.1